MKYPEFKNYLVSKQFDTALNIVSSLYNDSILKLQTYALLRAAVEDDYLAGIKFLINDCKLDVNSPVDKWGNKILFFAKDQVTAQLLVVLGADVADSGFYRQVPLHKAANASVAVLFKNADTINKQDIIGNTPLHTASKDGRQDVVQFLLSNGADFSILNKRGQTVLHLAKGADIAETLVKKGMDVDIKDFKGRTALHLSKDADLTELLLDEGADIEAKDNKGQSPLHYALMSYSKKSVAKTLINSNADIYSKDNEGKSVLHKLKSLEIGKLLFRLYPEFTEENLDVKDNDGKTPIQYAITKGQKSLALLFIHSGANVNQTGDDGKSLLHLAYNKESVELLINKGIDVAKADENGNTALYDALFNGHEIVASLLYDKSPELTQVSKDELLKHAAEEGYLSALKFLVEKGGNLSQVDNQGKNLAYIALSKNKIEVAEYLISKGLAVTGQEKDALLYDAVISGITYVAEYLIDKGADRNKLVSGKGLMYHSVTKGKLSMIEMLFSKGIKLSDSEEQLLISAAIQKGDLNCIDLLVDHLKVNINKADSSGSVPLHKAVTSGKKTVIDHLVSKGASASLINKNQLLDHAMHHNHNKVAEWLISQGVNKDAALLKAVKSGKTFIVSKLIEAGANVMQLDTAGSNLLNYAADRETVKLLLQAKPELGAQSTESSKAAMKKAISEGRAEVAEFFMNKGIEFDQAEKDVMLNNAVKAGQFKTVEMLINYGAHVNQEMDNPLHNAARHGNKVIAELLVKKGADINKADQSGRVAVDYATGEAANYLGYAMVYKEIQGYSSGKDVSSILSRMQNVNTKNDQGETLLMHAAYYGKLGIVQLIMARGGDWSVENNGKQNALYKAF